MPWKKAFAKGKEIVLASSSKNNFPHAIVVISLGFVKDKLLIGACQMKTTLKNLQQNPRAAIVATTGGYYRMLGRAKIYSKGNYFSIATKRSQPPLPRKAIVIQPIEVFDLDKVKKILKK